MDQHSRAEVINRYRKQYKRAPKSEKTKIITIIEETTGYSRKYIIQALAHKANVQKKITRNRVSRYRNVLEPLEKVWAASNFLCGKRLAPFLPVLLSALKTHKEIELTEEEEALLKSMSAATIDRLLCPIRQKMTLKGRATTKPGTLLKHKIAVRTFADWNENKPGFLEIDLVAHCGDSVRGEYINTLDMTDVATGWTTLAAFMGRSDRFCSEAIDQVRSSIPFPILGVDSDNGGEFINNHFKRYCERNQITFTRGRPNKKNDSCYVEQKNWDVVRKMIGYKRLDTDEQLDVLRRIYNLLSLYQNYFQPSQKLLSKERIGAKTKKKYDEAQTPCQRLLAKDDVPEHTKNTLRSASEQMNPAEMLRSIMLLVDELYQT